MESARIGFFDARRGFLHRPAVDLLILAGPWVFLAVMHVAGKASASGALGVWISQFILGNTTHVVLTFVLLAFRRDVLSATRKQTKIVIVGSILTFVLSLALFKVVDAFAPFWISFPLAVGSIFGTHHRLSQAKGIWSLYNLRAFELTKSSPQSGLLAPSARERAMQQHWVSIGLVLVMVAWLFIPTASNRMFPLIQAIPNEPAFLPYEVAYGLCAVWCAFVGVLLYELSKTKNVPKMLHVATHGAAVAMAILMPVWGGIVWGAIHGLEYYFLCARMMSPRPGDRVAGPGSFFGSRLAIWTLIALSMSPLLLVGLWSAPFATALGSPAITHDALMVVSSLVLAHYFADAFIYRFRIPEVRKVALTRLGFA